MRARTCAVEQAETCRVSIGMIHFRRRKRSGLGTTNEYVMSAFSNTTRPTLGCTTRRGPELNIDRVKLALVTRRQSTTSST